MAICTQSRKFGKRFSEQSFDAYLVLSWWRIDWTKITDNRKSDYCNSSNWHIIWQWNIVDNWIHFDNRCDENKKVSIKTHGVDLAILEYSTFDTICVAKCQPLAPKVTIKQCDWHSFSMTMSLRVCELPLPWVFVHMLLALIALTILMFNYLAYSWPTHSLLSLDQKG